MSLQRRTIKIRMSPRVAADSSEILNVVATTYQNDNLEIDINEFSIEKSRPNAAISGASEIASKTLDLQDQAIRNGLKTISTPEEAEQVNRQWLTTMKGEGIKISALVILREMLSRTLDFFT